MATIFDLEAEYMTLLDALEDPDYDQDILMEHKKDLEEELEAKAEGWIKVAKQMDADAEAMEVEGKKLLAKSKAIKNNSKRMKSVIQSVMEATGKMKFKTALFSFNIQKNPVSLVLHTEDIKEIPPEFLVEQDPTIDRAKIKELLQNGEELPFAHLEQGQSLRVR